MAFYKNYTPGEAFEHTAARENDISQLLNQTQGIGGGRIAGKTPGTVRLKCYNASASGLTVGTAVEFDSEEPMCEDAVPIKALSDAGKPWGVLEFDLAAGQFGNVIVSGPATVFASGTVADYVSPDTADPDVFQFASSGAALVLHSTALIGEVKKCVILLGGGGGGGAPMIYDGTVTSGVYVADYSNGDIHRIASPSGTLSVSAIGIPLGHAILLKINNAAGATVYHDGAEVVESTETGVYLLTFANLSGVYALYSKMTEA